MPDSGPGPARHRRLLAPVTGCILFATLATGLFLPHALGGGCIALSLLAMIWLTRTRRWHRPRLRVEEKRLIFAFLFYAGVQLVVWLLHGDYLERGRYLSETTYLLTALPIYLMLRQIAGLDSYVRAGLIAGAITAGLFALWVLSVGGPALQGGRVSGPASPLWFGGLSLAFGLMMLAPATRPHARLAERFSALLGLALALVASAASGSRGGWLALPVILALYPVTLGRNFGPSWRWGLAALVAVLSALILAMPGMPLGNRLLDGTAELTAIFNGGASSGSVGLRLELWRLAIETWWQNPLLGGDFRAFETALESAVADGRLVAEHLELRHAHNVFLQALSTSGLLGLLALLVLIGVPLAQCLRWLGRRHLPLGVVAWFGLVGVVVIAAMGFTEAVFTRNDGAQWFGLLVAVTYALAYQRRQAALADSSGRGGRSLSVIIIACNEADRIGECLDSVDGWADEIIVFDSGSTDDTRTICRQYNVRLYETDWPGFGVQKQRALAAAGGDWILSLDADERATAHLRNEIDRVVRHDDKAVAGYTVRWHLEAFGGHMDFGRWTRAPLRLFRRDCAHFDAAPVHERVIIEPGRGTVRGLDSILRHAIYRGREHAREKHARYAELQARARHAQGRRCRRLDAPVRATATFLDNYILRLGLLDGRHGWFLARETARYTWLKYHRLWQLGRQSG